jgi:hypothetical protein
MSQTKSALTPKRCCPPEAGLKKNSKLKCIPECSLEPSCHDPCPETLVATCNDPCPEVCPEVDPCPKISKECKASNVSGWSWLGALILWFIIFTVLFWLIFYSLKPSFVLQTDSNQVDTAKVLLSAVIAAIILVFIIWLIKAVISRRYA